MSADGFEEDVPQTPQMLQVDLKGFAGPLDLLLDLAQRQKVDLAEIAILPLAEQYLAFIEAARALRIELAADMLVMAAWLAYLKSRLLAPQAEDGSDEEAEAMAGALAFRLRRLEAMREAADALFARPRLGRDVFARGTPEVVAVRRTSRWLGDLFVLIAAYGSVRQGEIVREMTLEKRASFSLVDARAIMERLVGRGAGDWLPLEALIAQMPQHEAPQAVRASTFGATLEMAREGRIAMRQSAPFAPLFVRAQGTAAADTGREGAHDG